MQNIIPRESQCVFVEAKVLNFRHLLQDKFMFWGKTSHKTDFYTLISYTIQKVKIEQIKIDMLLLLRMSRGWKGGRYSKLCKLIEVWGCNSAIRPNDLYGTWKKIQCTLQRSSHAIFQVIWFMGGWVTAPLLAESAHFAVPLLLNLKYFIDFNIRWALDIGFFHIIENMTYLNH